MNQTTLPNAAISCRHRPVTTAEPLSRVLVVDDDAHILRIAARSLSERGFHPTTCSDPRDAVAVHSGGGFDVILTDIQMPAMNGIEFLRNVRDHDLDVPVVLMTGDPNVASAVSAIEYGAFGYIVKPLALDALADTLRRAATLGRVARVKRQALELLGVGQMALGDLASLESRFASALAQVRIAFQPIVDWTDRSVVSFEALVRTGEPTLARPDDLFAAAERLGRLWELGRTIRARVSERAVHAPEGARLFVNLHPRDLEDPELLGDACPLHRHADRVVLEVTERASLEALPDVVSAVHALRQRGYRIAIDDLGAGYAGLSSFTQLEPDIVKLDMSLVRGIDAHASKRRIVRAMVRLCGQLGIEVVGEGVETAGERDVLSDLGCRWLQGYLFAKPGADFPRPAWATSSGG